MTRRIIPALVAIVLVAATLIGNQGAVSAATTIQVRTPYSFDFDFDFCGPLVHGHSDVDFAATLSVGDTLDATGFPVLRRLQTHYNTTGTLTANGKTLLHSDTINYHDVAITYAGPATLPDGTIGARYISHEILAGVVQLRWPNGGAVLVSSGYTSADLEVILAAGYQPYFALFTEFTSDPVTHGHGQEGDFCQAIQQSLG